jgi:cyanophycinase
MRQHKKHLLALILLCFFFTMHAQNMQGNLLVVGGGSENYNSWSDTPYAWAVNKAQNKRIAIIGTDASPTTWLPNYFVSLGAVFAKNFPITNNSTANAQATYDSLVTYDMIFFRGGNQYNYYNRYKNTLTQQAVQEVFDRGGVIGGTSAGLHILSKVVYTAQNGTVYPDEALANPHNQYMTLADDFLDLLPGIVFDSHFAERARFGRLMGFLAKWFFDHNEDITGIGIDDKTAICIDAEMNAIVYGTGAANIYKAGEGNQYSLSGTKLAASNLHVSQMVHGSGFNLNTFEMQSSGEVLNPVSNGPASESIIWLSGSDLPAKNQNMLTLLGLSGNMADKIIIVTTGNTAFAGQYASILTQLGFENEILVANQTTGADPEWVNKLNNSSKFLFAGCSYDPLIDFVENSAGGQALKSSIMALEKYAAFIGDNSRFAGKSFLNNYTQSYAGYDGLFDFKPGLGLLRNSLVMPKTFDSSVDNENTATGVVYGMVRDSLKFGIWLHDNCVAWIYPEENKIKLRALGNFPLILAENIGAKAGFTDQSAVNSGNPRAIAAFDKFVFRLMDETLSVDIDFFTSVDEINFSQNLFYPNPFLDRVFLANEFSQALALHIYDGYGRKLYDEILYEKKVISLPELKAGIYYFRLTDVKGKTISVQKMIRQ